MLASKLSINWNNYQLVDNGRDKRNEVAHKGMLHSKYICLKFINAIEDELTNWNFPI
jgi:hypothetical protein